MANAYLHYVYDLWVVARQSRHERSDMIVARYADDTVAGFQMRWQAEQFLKALHQRPARFGLSLHSGKTRLIRFGRYAMEQCRRIDGSKPEMFDFLGFIHYCTRSFATDWYMVGRKTKKKRMLEQLQGIRHKA